MKQLKIVVLAAVAALSAPSFAQDISLGKSGVSYHQTNLTSSQKQKYAEFSQDVLLYGQPLTVSVQGGQSKGEDIYGLSLETGTSYKLSPHGWNLNLNAGLTVGSVRLDNTGLWAAGSNFANAKSTTMLDVSATSVLALAKERSFSLDLVNQLGASQGLATFTTNYHPVVFRNGLELNSKTSVGRLKLSGAYAQYSGTHVQTEYAKEFKLSLERKDWDTGVAYVKADNGVDGFNIFANMKF